MSSTPEVIANEILGGIRRDFIDSIAEGKFILAEELKHQEAYIVVGMQDLKILSSDNPDEAKFQFLLLSTTALTILLGKKETCVDQYLMKSAMLKLVFRILSMYFPEKDKQIAKKIESLKDNEGSIAVLLEGISSMIADREEALPSYVPTDTIV